MLDAWEGEWGPLAPLDEMRIYLLDYLGRPEEADAWFVAHQDTVETARRDLEARLADRAEKRALIPAMEEALRRNPLHPTARADLALTLWKVGRPDDARAYFDQAVVQEPGNAQLRSDAVRFWISQDDPGKAFSLLQDAQEEDGQLHGELLCLRARVRGMLGEAEARVDDLRACRREGGELGPTEWPLVQED